MPPNPNRQAIAQLRGLVSLDDVENFVDQQPPKAAFLPLTSQAQQAPPQQEEEYVVNPNANASYWDWPQEGDKQAVIDSIVKEEANRQVLSVSHIEENLIKSAAAAEQNVDMLEQADNMSDDDYWTMPSENDVPVEESKMVTAQHVQDATHPNNSYWDWPAAQNTKSVLIAKILADENARQVTSLARIEEHLRRNQQAPSEEESSPNPAHDSYWTWKDNDVVLQEAPHVRDETHPRNAYWDWNNDKESVLETIVKEEEIRQVLSATHIEETERSFQPNTCAPVVVAPAGSADASYWDW